MSSADRRPLVLAVHGTRSRVGTETSKQLAAAVAQQAGVSWEFLGEHLIPDEIAALLPAHLALHYSVVPLREERHP